LAVIGSAGVGWKEIRPKRGKNDDNRRGIRLLKLLRKT
jgi:hypothetical protein